MNNTTNHLNPVLFCLFQSIFGDVTVDYPGEAMVARGYIDREGEPRIAIHRWGETYRTRCPFCGETSLAVNHCYGQRNELGRLMTDVVMCCSSSECLVEHGKHMDLAQMLGAFDGSLEDAKVRPGRVVPNDHDLIELPEPLTRLDHLYERHPACRYLVRLGLDPDRVGRVYKVGYGGESAEPFASGKVIIPVKSRGVNQGWKALEIPDDEVASTSDALPMRIYSAPALRASELVYNLDRARAYEAGIIVSTPIDVWRFGAMAVSPLSKVWSERHCRTIAKAFRHKPLVLVADATRLTRPSTQEPIEFFRSRMDVSFVVVRLPRPRRKAFDRKFLRNLVAEEAETLGVHVQYNKTF